MHSLTHISGHLIFGSNCRVDTRDRDEESTPVAVSVIDLDNVEVIGVSTEKYFAFFRGEHSRERLDEMLSGLGTSRPDSTVVLFMVNCGMLNYRKVLGDRLIQMIQSPTEIGYRLTVLPR